MLLQHIAQFFLGAILGAILVPVVIAVFLLTCVLLCTAAICLFYGILLLYIRIKVWWQLWNMPQYGKQGKMLKKENANKKR